LLVAILFVTSGLLDIELL